MKLRYYRKGDFVGKNKIPLEIISENEVFLTESSDFAFVDTINGLCKILTYEDYDKL
jgi:hypothetical protein